MTPEERTDLTDLIFAQLVDRLGGSHRADAEVAHVLLHVTAAILAAHDRNNARIATAVKNHMLNILKAERANWETYWAIPKTDDGETLQ